MVLHTEYPYCSNNLDIMKSYPPKVPIIVECPVCERIFEYIHGFGSFDLPRKGKGAKTDKRFKVVSGKSNIDVNYAKRPQIISCSIILISMIAGIGSLLFSSIPLTVFPNMVFVPLASVTSFFIIMFVLIRLFRMK